MNYDRMEGNWEQLKGKLRETWGKLTDDDLTKIEGKRQALSGRIQERYGYAKEAAEKEIEKFMGDKTDRSEASNCTSSEKKSSCCP